MKVGFYCESPADQAALAVLTEAILGEPLEPITMDLRAHSVPGFFSALDGVIRGVHWNSDAEALIVLVDCDDAELHNDNHDERNSKDCRLCRIRTIVARVQAQLKPRVGLPPLRIAIGVPFPAIEAWLLTGKENVGEVAWLAGVPTGRLPRARLKKLVLARIGRLLSWRPSEPWPKHDGLLPTSTVWRLRSQWASA